MLLLFRYLFLFFFFLLLPLLLTVIVTVQNTHKSFKRRLFFLIFVGQYKTTVQIFGTDFLSFVSSFSKKKKAVDVVFTLSLIHI